MININNIKVVAPKLDHGMVGKFEVTTYVKPYILHRVFSVVMDTC